MGKVVREYFYGNSTWTAPGGVKYIIVYSFKNSQQVLGGTTTTLLNSYGSAYCWGSNANGVLGNNSATSAFSSPVAVVGGLTFASLYTATSFNFGITPKGVAYGWGANGNGELGDGSTTSRSSPVTVAGGLLFQKITANNAASSFGLTPSGAVYAWGINGSGQLGDGTSTQRSSPVAVLGGLAFADIVTGVTGGTTCFTVGLTTSGAAYAWGTNAKGQMGDGTTTTRTSPTAVLGGLTFSKIFLLNDTAANGGTVFALTSSGTAYAWGSNGAGILGVGDTTPRSSPVAVLGGLSFVNIFSVIANGGASAYFLTSSGALYATGSNSAGQLGDGTTTARSSPVAVIGGLSFIDVMGGVSETTTYGLTTSGSLYAWGYNANGQLGVNDTTSRSSPVAVVGGLTFSRLATSSANNMYAMTPGGVVYAWGQNSSGSLGVNDTTPRSSPVAVVGGVTAAAAITQTVKRISVVPGTSYTVGIKQLNAQLGAEALGAGPFDYIIVEHEI